MDTLHCGLENGADLYVNERQKIRHLVTFYITRCISKIALYSDVIQSLDWKSAVEHDRGV